MGLEDLYSAAPTPTSGLGDLYGDAPRQAPGLGDLYAPSPAHESNPAVEAMLRVAKEIYPEGMAQAEQATLAGLQVAGDLSTKDHLATPARGVMWALENLDRPANAIRGVLGTLRDYASNALEPHERSGTYQQEGGYDRGAPISPPDTRGPYELLVEPAVKGFLREKTYSAVDELKKQKVLEHSPYLQAALGAIMDLGAPDPLMAGPVKSVLRKGYQLAGQAAEKATVATHLADGINTVFNTRLGKSEAVKTAMGVMDAVPQQLAAAEGKLYQMMAGRSNVIDQLAADNAILTETQRARIFAAMEDLETPAQQYGLGGKRYLTGSNAERELVEQFKADNAVAALADMRAGGLKAPLDSKVVAYGKHKLTLEAQELLAKRPGAKSVSSELDSTINALEARVHHGSTKHRVHDMDAASANQMAWDTGQLPLGVKLFYDDPVYVNSLRLTESIRALTAANAIEEVAKKTGVPVDLGVLETLQKWQANAMERVVAQRGRVSDAVTEGLAGTSPWGNYVSAAHLEKAIRQNHLLPAEQNLSAFLKPFEGKRIYTEGLLKGHAIDEDVATWMAEWHRLQQPKEVGKAMQRFDKFNTWWKSWSLATRPAYFLRNDVQNFLLNDMADIKLRDYLTSGLLQSGFRHPQAVLTKTGWPGAADVILGGKPVTYDRIMMEFENRVANMGEYATAKQEVSHVALSTAAPPASLGRWQRGPNGQLIHTPATAAASLGSPRLAGAAAGAVVGGGVGAAVAGPDDRVGGGIMGALAGAAGGAAFPKWVPFGATKDNELLRAGFAFGTSRENNARLAHFVGKLRTGMDFEQAAASVKKYLYDYSNASLSAVEREGFKRIAPFYGYSRRNLPRMAEELITNPGKATKALKFKQAFESGQDNVDDTWLAKWMQSGVPVKLGRRAADPNVQAVLMLGSYLPIADLQKVWGLDELRATALQMMGPAAKLPVEVASLFSGDGQGIDITRSGQMGEIVPIRQGGAKVPFLGMWVDPGLAHVLRTMVAANEFDRWNPGDVFGGQYTDAQPAPPGERPRLRQDPPALDRVWQFFTGLRVYDSKLEKQGAMVVHRQEKQIRELVHKAQMRGIPSPGFPKGDEQGVEEILSGVKSKQIPELQRLGQLYQRDDRRPKPKGGLP